MRKLFSLCAAMLVAFAVNAAAVVLPATLDVSNVGFRSEGMPDFVLEEGDYAGTYFDMGAHDNPSDTLLYAEWDVTIQPIKYNFAVDVYNTNSWTVQLHLLNQAGDTVKALRYKGSSGKSGNFTIGTIDMRDLEAGNYKLRARAARDWSAMKLKDVIVAADYQGVTVALPGTLQPAYAELSANASISDGAIAFKPSTAPDEYANWNVSFAKAGNYNVTIDITATNGHNYGVELIGEDEETSYGAVNEGGQKSDTGVKELGAIEVPAAGNYIVHLTNATQWSEAVLNSITFASTEKDIYFKPGEWANDGAKFWVYAFQDAKPEYKSGFMTLAPMETAIYTTTIPVGYTNVVFVRMSGETAEPTWTGLWNQTEDMVIPEGKDMFTFTSWTGGAGGKSAGTWSKYGEVIPEAPDAAPANPTVPSEQVKAVYSATYKADCDFGEWGSDTQYAQETYGKKYITTSKGYFGLAFEGRRLNCSKMEKLHLDAWIATDASIRVVPIHGGEEVGVTVNLTGQQWNSIDIALSEFVGVTNWSDVYQIKIDYAANLTFWLNNVYFYSTVVPTYDLEDGYYLIGNINGVAGTWTIEDLTAERLLTVDPEDANQYMIDVTLAKDDQLQIVSVADDAIGTWYPGGEGNNYVVSADLAGKVTVYFLPAKDGDESWWKGCIKVEKPEPVGCDWENLSWVGSALAPKYVNQFKVCVGENAPNIDVFQHPGWASEEGLYMTFPSAVWDKEKFSISADQYDLQGAGMIIHASVFELNYTEVTINCDNKDFTFTVYNANGPEAVYTVVGSSEVAFGTSWDLKNADNKMALEDGLYKWEKTELSLAAGEITFKVAKNHSWTEAWPEGNYVLNIPSEGLYTISITFNESTKEVNATVTKTGEAVVLPVIKLHGNFDGEWKDTDPFAEAGDKKSASLTVALDKGKYAFGLKKDGNWYANGSEFTRENPSAVIESNTNVDMSLDVDKDGAYTFTWTFETNTLDVDYPGCHWNELAWLGSTDATYANQFKVCVGDPTPNVVNIQKPGFASEIGIYLEFPSAVWDKSKFSLPESKYAIQGAGMVIYLSAFSAKETEVTIGCDNKDFIFTVYNAKGTDTPTSIDNNVVETKAVKYIQNGQLFIEMDGKVYNIVGARVK